MTVQRLPFFSLIAFCATADAAPLDDFSLRTGGYLTRLDVEIRADGASPGSGTTVDFDRELGLDNDALPAFAAVAWRPWRRHEFGVSHYQVRLAGTRRLDREIFFQGERLEADATVHSDFTLETFDVHYTWWPWLRECWALGVRVGFLEYDAVAGLRVLATMDDGETANSPRIEVRDDVPAFSLGVDYRWTPAADWRMYASAGAFKAEFETVSPVVLSARLGMEYLPWEEFGLWADLGVNHFDADVHSSHFDGALLIVEGGLRLGVTWRP